MDEVAIPAIPTRFLQASCEKKSSKRLKRFLQIYRHMAPRKTLFNPLQPLQPLQPPSTPSTLFNPSTPSTLFNPFNPLQPSSTMPSNPLQRIQPPSSPSSPTPQTFGMFFPWVWLCCAVGVLLLGRTAGGVEIAHSPIGCGDDCRPLADAV